MKYKFANFDFDGTLADSFPFFIAVFNQLAEVLVQIWPFARMALFEHNGKAQKYRGPVQGTTR